MSPGDVRTFKRGQGNAVVIGHGLWATKQGKWIHIHLTGPDDSHTTVTNNPDSVRHHRILFRDLRRTLINQGCWPFGEEGGETLVEERAMVPARPEEHILIRLQPIQLRGKGLTASEIVLQDRGRL